MDQFLEAINLMPLCLYEGVKTCDTVPWVLPLRPVLLCCCTPTVGINPVSCMGGESSLKDILLGGIRG